jgi:UDP-2,3-diacylglucosamine pyrophosphatase LpxH
MQRVFDGHPAVFRALREFLNRGHVVRILAGNHDVDLYWPQVQQMVREQIHGNTPCYAFVEDGYIFENGIYIEHGHQYSFDNSFEHWPRPILLGLDGVARLERPWGTYFMDMIYNEIEDIYPFVNKVYPHAQLAWAALRSFGNEANVSPWVIARLLAFFLTSGKRMLLEHMLGQGSHQSEGIDADQLVIEVGIDGSRRADVMRELGTVVQHARVSVGDGELPNMLGRNDTNGQRERARTLHEKDEASIVVFGHTHHPMSPAAPYGDERRWFNTGSWMPMIEIGDRVKPNWSELSKLTRSHDIRCLLIERRDVVDAVLHPLAYFSSS